MNLSGFEHGYGEIQPYLNFPVIARWLYSISTKSFCHFLARRFRFFSFAQIPPADPVGTFRMKKSQIWVEAQEKNTLTQHSVTFLLSLGCCCCNSLNFSLDCLISSGSSKGSMSSDMDSTINLRCIRPSYHSLNKFPLLTLFVRFRPTLPWTGIWLQRSLAPVAQ